ncbi:Gfo/Idh/MocA family oxidoreductase [Thalassomonas sp. RHCl1]|uniref:Gfo/Idh/MocA family protein n=1 Tax=Thalassomonas sp. RHCl1 TaxID=2995320 RepID=UPI00248B13BC|nr:Gfo/Idh/MocA family oxidoreductase [Thalassomonas sp. RHCl1]
MSNIALIGCGSWGKNIARVLKSLDSLYSITDTDQLATQNLSYKYNVCVKDFKDVLSDPLVDGVVIATSATTHFELACKVINSGKHVFVEKPMTICENDAEKLNNLANKKKRILMIGHLMHYHPIYRKIKALISTDYLGQLKYLYSNRLSLGRIRSEENVLWSLAPHDVSMILDLVNEFPTSVEATGVGFLSGENLDSAIINLGFGEVLGAHVHVSWANPFKEQRLVIVGDKGMLVFDDCESSWQKKLVFYEHKYHVEKNGIPMFNKASPVFIEVKREEPLYAEIKHFIDCIKDNVEPISNGEEAFSVVKVLALADKSISKARHYSVDAT